MASLQRSITEDYPIRKTRSSSRSASKVAEKSFGLRSRKICTPLFKDQLTETSEICEDAKPSTCLLASKSPARKTVTARNEVFKSLTTESPPKNSIVSERSPRRNLASLFDVMPDQIAARTPCFRTPKKSDQIVSPTKRTPSPIKTPRKSCTPLKENRENCIPSPRTPKRQSTEVLRIAATSPPKRKKELNQVNKTFTPVALFKQDVSSYHAAKEVLHSSTPSRLVTRDRQINDIREFLNEHLEGNKPGCLYISGAPGTGKTACLTQILQELKEEDDFKSIFINCMTIHQSGSIFEKIITSLGGKKGNTIKDNVKIIEKLICKRKQMIVLVLDEMDQLSTKSQHVLYSVFEWPRLHASNLVLIGIANSLDMTDRILPRLHACGCKPTLLHFPPYTQNQITTILQDRLKDVTSEIIKPVALQFCARKIAAQTGDVRKALDTCRRAVEVVEKSVRNQPILCPTSDDGFNPGSPRRSPRKSSVELSHIMNVLHDVYGSRVVTCNADKTDLGSGMPIQQKLLLCTLLLLTKRKSKGRDLTLGKLHEVYAKVCRVHKVEDLPYVDFQEVCVLAETNGVVQIKKNKEARLSKVFLKVDEDELQFVMKDRSLLAAVLEDHSVLKGTL